MPRSTAVHSVEEAERIAADLGYPVVIRPAYTMGGTGGGLVYNVEELRVIASRGISASLIGQILVEMPDPVAAGGLAALRRDVEQFPAGTGQSWRAVFERASLLRDNLLLRRIEFDALLLVKRKPYTSEQPFMDAHHLRNRPGGGIYRLA